MVTANLVIEGNKAFSRRHWDDKDIVGVFAGATSGIGARTLERMATMFRAPTYYVLVRPCTAAHFATRRKKIERLNPECRIICIETDASLISGVDAGCAEILASAPRVDFLYMSMGTGLPLGGAQYTAEGLEVCFTLSYTSRVRMLHNLLPLLNKSSRPRVLSVLAGGKEKRIDEQDVGLERSWTILKVVGHTTLLNSVVFDHIAAQNPKLALIHNAPGLVESDNIHRARRLADVSLLRRVFIKMTKVVLALIRYFIGTTPNEAGERQTYHLTNERYSPGSCRVDRSSEVVPDNEALAYYKQDESWGQRFWEFTLNTWKKALGSDI